VKIAFLGLGRMGRPMAMNVLAGGHEVRVWNRTPERTASLVAAGARAASSPGEAAAPADLVIAMLANPAATSEVLLGPDGATARLAPGAMVVDMSTGTPGFAQDLARQLAAKSLRFIDAPVSGSVAPATEGKLMILAAGSEADVEFAREPLSRMGEVIRVGDVGQGMAMKLVLNSFGAHVVVALGAVLVLGSKLGVASQAMLQILLKSKFASPQIRDRGRRMVDHDFKPDFTLELMLKDQTLVESTARQVGYEMPSQRAVCELASRAVAAGFGPDDLSGLVRLLESFAGVKL
jgi:3-hydroxyisobutyrate dehydrogenase-like beta-hydroxyacid dehydrogenase